MIEIRSFRDLLRLFFIFRRDFVWAFSVTVVMAIAGAFLLPARFASEARMMVKPGRENLSVPIDAPDRQTVVSQSTQRDPIVDEEKILTGRPVVDRVTEQFLNEFDAAPAPQGGFALFKYQIKKGVAAVAEGLGWLSVQVGLAEAVDEKERLGRRFVERFEVSHTPGSAVMEVRFKWNNPAIAQRVLDVWLRTYLEERARILGRGNLVGFYEERSATSARQAEAAKMALQASLEQIDGISAKERLDTLTERLNLVKSRNADAAGELVALRRGIDVSARRMAELPREVLTDRESGPDPSWLALNAQLAELKRQRVEALRTFKEGAPAVAAIDESISVLEARVRNETRDAARLERRSANTITTSLQQGSVDKAVRLEELNALVASYTKEASELEAERQRVVSAAPELARLERELVAAEKSTALYLESLEKARIDQALDENRISNVALVESATFNPARVFPQSFSLLIAALPVGILVGLIVVYLRSMLDQRIHDGSSMESRFGVKLWSTVKALRNPAGADSSFDASIFRLYSRLPLERVATHGLTLALTSARVGEGTHFIGRHLQALLVAEQVNVVIDPPSGRAEPGQFALLLAPGLNSNREALAKLRHVDLIVLVVEARTSTLPAVEHAISLLSSAFGRVDGVVVNRREFEIPARLLRWLGA